MQYSEIACVGSNIQLKEKVINIDGSDTIVNIVNVTRLKNRVLCITTTVSEVLSVKSDTIIIPSTSRYDNSMHEVSHSDDDGIVLLFYVMVPSKMRKYNMEFDT